MKNLNPCPICGGVKYVQKKLLCTKYVMYAAQNVELKQQNLPIKKMLLISGIQAKYIKNNTQEFSKYSILLKIKRIRPIERTFL